MIVELLKIKAMTTQKDVYETARQMNVKAKYVVGMCNFHWQIVRMRDYAILYEAECSEDHIKAELFSIGISKEDVSFI